MVQEALCGAGGDDLRDAPARCTPLSLRLDQTARKSALFNRAQWPRCARGSHCTIHHSVQRGSHEGAHGTPSLLLFRYQFDSYDFSWPRPELFPG
jgi:hypothetical protein